MFRITMTRPLFASSLFSALVAALGAVGLAAPQTVLLDDQLIPPIDLSVPGVSSALPFYSGGSISARNIENHRLTVGDLNADGVPDLVFSNGLAFLRAYFLQPNPTTGGLDVLDDYDVLTYTNNFCVNDVPPPNGSADWRLMTIASYAIDNPLIYDIDLDGINDLIYLKHYPGSANNGKGRFGFQVYEYAPGPGGSPTLVEKAHTSQNTSALDLTSFFLNEDYYASSCTLPKDGGKVVSLRIVNVRGKALPQDILVWTASPPYSLSFRVYAYDSAAGTDSLTLLFSHATNTGNPWPGKGDPGHNWRGADINYDGLQEIIGRNIVSWNPTTSIKQVLWGMVFSDDDQPSGNQLHPDHLAALDFMAVYADKANPNKLIPSPGIEILVAPQIEGSAPNKPDPSGPWVYRAISGHTVGPFGSEVRAWPRKLLNLNQTNDGLNYWFPSTNPTWDQPKSTSHWNHLGIDLGGFNSNPNAQVVIPANLIADDEKTGPELLVISKASLVGGGGGCSSQGHLHYLFDSTSALTALAWDQSTGVLSSGTNGPTIQHPQAIDILGTRDALEVSSLLGVGCPWPAHYVHHAVFRWTPIPSPTTKTYDAEWVYRLVMGNIPPLGERFDTSDGIAAADILGDSREELLIRRLYPNGFQDSDVIIVRDPDTTVVRQEPTPWRYLEYRMRSFNDIGYPDYVDFAGFDGVRFTATRLLKGTVSQVYGVPQDRALDVGGQVRTGCVEAVNET